MTEHKHLKARIRARMQRTGETYSTARRHILAGAVGLAGTWPSAVLPTYPRDWAGEHHDPALAARLLAAVGVRRPDGATYAEAMLAGLAGGIGFMYAVFEYRGLPPMLTIVARHHPEPPFLPAAVAATGTTLVEEHASSQARAAARLAAAIAAGRPAVCLVDRSRLADSEHADPAVAADPHPVTVIGIDGDAVWLDDGGIAPRWLPREGFLAAWSGHRKGRHAMYTVTAPPSADHNLPGAVESAIAMTAAHLTGRVLGHAFDVNFGLSGMTRLRDHLAASRGKQSWQVRFGASAQAMEAGLTRLHDCLEIEYTGPAAGRPQYAAFLREAAGLTDRPGLAAAADVAEQAGKAWSSLAAEALSASQRGPDVARAVFDTLAGLVDEALTLERALATRLLP